MNDIEVSSIDLVEGGNVFKQGHYLTLGYVPRDEKGETVDLSGKTLNVALWENKKGIAFEAPATFSNGVIRFTLNETVAAGDYQVEFTATSSVDLKYRKKFPANKNSGRISIKQSSDDVGMIGISVYTVEKFEKKQKEIQDAYKQTVDSKVSELESEFDAAVGAITVDSEVVIARGAEPTLNQRLQRDNAVVTQWISEIDRNRKVVSGLSSDPVKNQLILQTAIDNLANGDELYIPANSWVVQSTLFVSNKSNIKIIGIGKCRLKFNSSVYAGIFVHGGTLSSRTNQGCREFALLDFDNSRTDGVELNNLSLESNLAGRLNTAISLDWTKNCKITNCSVKDSDGNNYEIRHSENPKLVGITSDNCADYSIFFFQCSTPTVDGFTITNCRRGIIVKHNYKKKTNSGIIRNGTIRNCSDMYIGGGENYPITGEPYYIEGSEVVDNVTISNVVFDITIVPTISVLEIGVYADSWKLNGLKFLCNGLNVKLFNIGNVGDFYTNGLGVTGGNHLIKDIDINNLDSVRSVFFGTSFSMENINLTDCKYLLFVDRDPVNVNTSKLSKIIIQNVKTVRCTQKLGLSGESGFIRTHSALEDFSFINNQIAVDVEDYSTNAVLSFFSAIGKRNTLSNNNFSVKVIKATRPFTLQNSLANYTELINNYFLLNSNSTIRAIIAGSSVAVGGSKIDKNTFELSSSYTANDAYGIQTTKTSNVLSNTFLGLWTGLYLDQSAPFSLSLGTRRIVYGTAMPTAGTWQRDDIVILLNNWELGNVGNKYVLLGYKRMTNGSGNVLNTDWLELRNMTGN